MTEQVKRLFKVVDETGHVHYFRHKYEAKAFRNKNCRQSSVRRGPDHDKGETH